MSSNNPALVACDFKAGSYNRYLGRICTDKFLFVLPLSAQWIEEIRRDPGQFKEGDGHSIVADPTPRPEPSGGGDAA